MSTRGENQQKEAAGLGGLYLIAGGLAALGLFIASRAAKELAARQVDWEAVVVKSMAALIFGGAGVALFVLSRSGARREARESELKANHPDEPWLWKDEWAQGRISCSQRTTMGTAWGAGTLCLLISSPMVFQLHDEVVHKQNYAALLGLIFPLVGLGLLTWAVRCTLRYWKFGTSVLELAYVPAEIGGRLDGVVHVNRALFPEDGFPIKLTCIHRTVCRSGSRSSSRERVVWEEEAVMERELLESDPQRSAIPISFEIPDEARATTPPDAGKNSKFFWTLEVGAKTAGVDYAASFEVPVFHNRADSTTSAADGSFADRFRRPVNLGERRQRSRIAVTPLRGGGTEFRFPAARNPGPAIGLTLFSCLWGSTILLQLHFGFGWFFPLVTGLFLLLLLWLSAGLWLETSRVVFDGRRVLLQSGWCGGGRTREIPYEEIEDIRLGIGMQSGRRPFYDIELEARRPETRGRQLKSNLKLYAGRYIRDKQEAEWLADQMRECLTQPVRARPRHEPTRSPVTL